MPSRGGFDAAIGGLRDDGAERLRVGGVPESPDVFYLFLRELESLGDVDVGGEGLETRWVG